MLVISLKPSHLLMDTLRTAIPQITGVLGSYGVSLMAYLQKADLIALFTGLAGAILTFSMAYETISKGRINMQTARKLKLENDAKEEGQNIQP
jgi:hypothetical protein